MQNGFSGATPAFNNAGAFHKTASNGTRFGSLPFNNTGTVDVASGATLALNGGGSGAGTTGCTMPEAPPTTFADITAKSHAINQLIVAALSCNLTRVYTHLWAGPRNNCVYSNLNLTGGHHNYTHGSDGEEPRLIERYIMSQYADLANLMKAAPLGAGSVLDNTLIYGVSELAEPSTELMTNYHIVLMGHGGGKLAGTAMSAFPDAK
jgi:hypothetical protein